MIHQSGANQRPAAEVRKHLAKGPVGGAVVFAAALLGPAPTQSLAAERPLVLEAVAPGLWRADAKGMTMEFLLDAAGDGAVLRLRFVGSAGDEVAPPAARRVTLKSPSGRSYPFALTSGQWSARDPAPAFKDGALLSIEERDHRHDYRLNIHPLVIDPPIESPR